MSMFQDSNFLILLFLFTLDGYGCLPAAPPRHLAPLPSHPPRSSDPGSMRAATCKCKPQQQKHSLCFCSPEDMCAPVCVESAGEQGASLWHQRGAGRSGGPKREEVHREKRAREEKKKKSGRCATDIWRWGGL